MSAGSGNFQHEIETSLLAQTTHWAGSGNFQHVATGRLDVKQDVPIAGSGSFQFEAESTLVAVTEPIPPGPERWDTPRYRFVGG